MLDDQEELTYTQSIKDLCKEYISITIQKAQKQPHRSNLVLLMIEQFELELDILKLIDNEKIVHEMHLSYVTKIQKQYFSQPQWDRYRNILYNIRKDIELGNKQVIPYNYSNSKDENVLVQDDQEKILKIQTQISEIQADNFFIKPKKCTELTTSFNEASKIFSKYNQDNKSHEVKFNIVYLLAFLDIDQNDITIWENFCEKSVIETNSFVQEFSIQILTYIIQNNKINMVTFTEVIQNRYPHLPPKEKYAEGIMNELKFELREVFNSCIENIITTDFSYEEQSYDNLLSLEQLNPNVKERIEYRKRKIPFTMIAMKDSSYCILNTDKSTKKTFENIEKIVEYILSRFDEDQNISQIKQFKHLIDNIKDKKFTMSHPYCFEDKIENQYDINEKLYISCWSFTAKRENAYAWWKLYGKHKNSFRSIITLRSLIISMISILDNYQNSTLYIGNIDYNKLGSIDDAYKHKSEVDFFNKREDFKFENELRIMMKIDEELLLFNPYDLTLLEKDKKAMIQILKKQNK